MNTLRFLCLAVIGLQCAHIHASDSKEEPIEVALLKIENEIKTLTIIENPDKEKIQKNIATLNRIINQHDAIARQYCPEENPIYLRTLFIYSIFERFDLDRESKTAISKQFGIESSIIPIAEGN